MKSESENELFKQSGSVQQDSLKRVCRDFMRKKCTREPCRFIHDSKLCDNYYRNWVNRGEGTCKYKDNCRKNHFVQEQYTPKQYTPKESGQKQSVKDTNRSQDTNRSKDPNRRQDRYKKPKNTECFEPMKTPVDMRLVFDLGTEKLTTNVTTRDVLIVPNIFADFAPGEIHARLMSEIENCDVPKDQLLKLWHGNDKIEGTHFIMNDRTRWKSQCPTFSMVIERIRTFFNMDIQATRFNWYKDTSQWKPFHHDSAYVNPEKAKVQNFTVAVSFGATRDAAFEHAKTKTVVSMPQGDGHVYCFSSDTNGIWRHGILQDIPVRDQSRISCICWGKIENMGKVANEE